MTGDNSVDDILIDGKRKWFGDGSAKKLGNLDPLSRRAKISQIIIFIVLIVSHIHFGAFHLGF